MAPIVMVLGIRVNPVVVIVEDGGESLSHA